jgi:hypothetical protein
VRLWIGRHAFGAEKEDRHVEGALGVSRREFLSGPDIEVERIVRRIEDLLCLDRVDLLDVGFGSSSFFMDAEYRSTCLDRTRAPRGPAWSMAPRRRDNFGVFILEVLIVGQSPLRRRSFLVAALVARMLFVSFACPSHPTMDNLVRAPRFDRTVRWRTSARSPPRAPSA